MIKKLLINFINPVKIYKAYRYKRKAGVYDRSKHDLELQLYARILNNDMLHWGYFNDSEIAADHISVSDMEEAQMSYAMRLFEHISNKEGAVLDSGCGMGGLSAILDKKGYRVEALTPDRKQIAYIRDKYPEIKLHHCKYQDIKTERKYGTIINSESIQYIPLDSAFLTSEEILDRGGRWIISDYFRLHDDGINKSSHLLEDFRKMIQDRNWKIVHEEDMTAHILPTARLINMYAERFLLPLRDFGFSKLRVKKPFMYFMSKEAIDSINKKIYKELASIDPEKFKKEKKYMLFVLERA